MTPSHRRRPRATGPGPRGPRDGRRRAGAGPTSTAASRVPGPAALALAAAAALAGCDVAWGGASVELEDPAPADTAAEGEASGPAPLPDLPEGPLLYVARLDSAGGARAVPAARLSGGGLTAMDWPGDPPSAWVDRFDSTFQRPGAELPLMAHGGRAGSLVLDDRRTPAGGGCPPVAGGEALLPAGQGAPEFAFASSPRDTAGGHDLVRGPTSTTSRIRTFAPILAERILGEAGVEQTFLARQADLSAVAMPGDTAPGMAATFLIRDSLTATPPPSGTSTSLFFLARFDRSEGYVPVWTRIRRYESGEGKEALAHLGWISAGGRPLHLVRRVTPEGVRLAAFRVDGGAGAGELAWVEPDRCPALEALERASPRAAAPAAGDTAP